MVFGRWLDFPAYLDALLDYQFDNSRWWSLQFQEIHDTESRKELYFNSHGFAQFLERSWMLPSNRWVQGSLCVLCCTIFHWLESWPLATETATIFVFLCAWCTVTYLYPIMVLNDHLNNLGTDQGLAAWELSHIEHTTCRSQLDALNIPKSM